MQKNRRLENKKSTKVSFKTRMRWLFLGKWPNERRSLPKILEYMLLVFTQIIILILEILILYLLGKNKWTFEGEYLENIVNEIKSYTYRILFSAALLSYIFAIFVCIHIYYILDKTEFYKWSGIIATIFALTFLSPLAIIFSIVAYEKNLIVFE